MPKIIADAIDQLISIEMRYATGLPRGVIRLIYEAAREAQGGGPLVYLAAQKLREVVSRKDFVLIVTGYSPPETDDAFPENITLSWAAAEYLANVPVRAFGTDGFSVASLQDTTLVEAESEVARAVPIHHAFLSRGIPVYEQLFNVDGLLEKAPTASMYFVGVPLNIKDGDGMIVRPVALVY